MDPAPLADHGLVIELLTRLSNAAGPAQTTVTGPSKFLFLIQSNNDTGSRKHIKNIDLLSVQFGGRTTQVLDFKKR